MRKFKIWTITSRIFSKFEKWVINRVQRRCIFMMRAVKTWSLMCYFTLWNSFRRKASVTLKLRSFRSPTIAQLSKNFAARDKSATNVAYWLFWIQNRFYDESASLTGSHWPTKHSPCSMHAKVNSQHRVRIHNVFTKSNRIALCKNDAFSASKGA